MYRYDRNDARKPNEVTKALPNRGQKSSIERPTVVRNPAVSIECASVEPKRETRHSSLNNSLPRTQWYYEQQPSRSTCTVHGTLTTRSPLLCKFVYGTDDHRSAVSHGIPLVVCS